jgi:hypothetical protein
MIVDDPFTVVKNGPDKAGLVLTDTIISKAQRDRPMTLICSIGARFIYSFLMSLANRCAFGLVEASNLWHKRLEALLLASLRMSILIMITLIMITFFRINQGVEPQSAKIFPRQVSQRIR